MHVMSKSRKMPRVPPLRHFATLGKLASIPVKLSNSDRYNGHSTTLQISRRLFWLSFFKSSVSVELFQKLTQWFFCDTSVY